MKTRTMTESPVSARTLFVAHLLTRPATRALRSLASAALLLLAAGSSDARATVTMAVDPSRAQVTQSGASATVCVGMSGSGGAAAGTQNDLTWDGNCATLLRCDAAPGVGKPLSAGLLPRTHFTLRALMLSLADTNPIRDGALYCCTFRVELAEPGACCSLAMSNARWSDSKGNGAGASVNGGELCLADTGGSAASARPRGSSSGPQNVPGVVGGAVAPAPGAPAPAATRGSLAVGGVGSAPTPQLPPLGGLSPDTVAAVSPPEGEVPQDQELAGGTGSAEPPVEQTAAQTPGRSAAARTAAASPAATTPAAQTSPSAPATAPATAASPPPTTAAPSAKPTPRMSPPPKAKAPEPTAAAKGGCAIASNGGVDPGPVLAGLVALILARRRR